MKWALILALAISPALHPANRVSGLCWGSEMALAQANRPTAPPASATEAMHQAEAAHAGSKIRHVRQNAQRPEPDPTPTVLSERELNAYLASGEVALPKGVQALKVAGQPGVITARARVDFDAIVAGARSANPLLGLFSGVHEVEAVAHASGAAGQGQVHVDSIALDGVVVPRMALELFVNRYLKPRYPNLGIDSSFKLPERISTATVGSHNLTVTQR